VKRSFQVQADNALRQFATVPMDRFPLKWRFTDPRYDLLPLIHLAQIKPVAPADARRLRDFIRQAGIHRDFPFTEGYFRSVVSTAIGDSHGDPVEDRRVRKWLFGRGIPFRQPILLSYNPESAIETSWKMLVRYWTAFYYPISDDITVIDESLNWALLFFHEHEVFFGSNKVSA
jgi:hypothetical protein